jgi:hypothetical protein
MATQAGSGASSPQQVFAYRACKTTQHGDDADYKNHAASWQAKMSALQTRTCRSPETVSSSKLLRRAIIQQLHRLFLPSQKGAVPSQLWPSQPYLVCIVKFPESRP